MIGESDYMMLDHRDSHTSAEVLKEINSEECKRSHDFVHAVVGGYWGRGIVIYCRKCGKKI